MPESSGAGRELDEALAALAGSRTRLRDMAEISAELAASLARRERDIQQLADQVPPPRGARRPPAFLHNAVDVAALTARGLAMGHADVSSLADSMALASRGLEVARAALRRLTEVDPAQQQVLQTANAQVLGTQQLLEAAEPVVARVRENLSTAQDMLRELAQRPGYEGIRPAVEGELLAAGQGRGIAQDAAPRTSAAMATARLREAMAQRQAQQVPVVDREAPARAQPGPQL